MEHRDEIRSTATRILQVALHGIEQAHANIEEAKHIVLREQERLDNLESVVNDLKKLIEAY